MSFLVFVRDLIFLANGIFFQHHKIRDLFVFSSLWAQCFERRIARRLRQSLRMLLIGSYEFQSSSDDKEATKVGGRTDIQTGNAKLNFSELMQPISELVVTCISCASLQRPELGEIWLVYSQTMLLCFPHSSNAIHRWGNNLKKLHQPGSHKLGNTIINFVLC